MIEADVVAVQRSPAKAVDPPVVAAGFHRRPIVKRAAPALPGGAEGVGGNAGDDLRFEVVLSEAKEVAMRPHVGAVVIDKNRDIAHHPDGALGAVKPQGMPLLVEEELNHATKINLGSHL